MAGKKESNVRPKNAVKPKAPPSPPKKEKHAGGRPTKYKEEYCELIVEIMKEGKTRVEAAYQIGVGRQSLNDWAAKYPEFSEALVKADAACESWWINKGRECLESQHFKTATWSMIMGNKFHWTNNKNSHEVTGKDGGAIKTENINATVTGEMKARDAQDVYNELIRGDKDG